MAVSREPQARNDAPSTGGDAREASLPITGMTCASCVRRVERALGRVEGVREASVNLATERARVAYDPAAVSPEQLRAAVERAGYGVAADPAPHPGHDGSGVTAEAAAIHPAGGESAAATVGETSGGEGSRLSARTADPREAERERALRDLRRRWVVSLAVGLVMMAEMYVPLGLDMALLAPLLLIQATVVQVWAGGGFYRAAWAAARHGGTTMDTLVAVGTSVALALSASTALRRRAVQEPSSSGARAEGDGRRAHLD